MRVWYDYERKMYYIHCCETRKTTHINATGAKKVASCCETEIEKFSTEDLKLEKEIWKN